MTIRRDSEEAKGNGNKNIKGILKKKEKGNNIQLQNI